MGGRAGKTLAPSDFGHELKWDDAIDFVPSPELLGWRRLLCQTCLEGFPREVASGSELLAFDDKHVSLRPRSRSFVTKELIGQLTKAIRDVTGSPFTVTFASGECTGEATSISKLERAEKLRAQKALIEAFRSDPFVQKCLQMFDATLDEASVRIAQEKGKKS